MSRFVAIDPGSRKCGVLLADVRNLTVIDGRVLDRSNAIKLIIQWNNEFPIDRIILGNGTSSKVWNRLLINLPSVHLVEEYGTTLRARERYWELWPPAWWLAWIPKGFFLPPEPLDAVAALILLEDYLNQKFCWPGNKEFKI